MSGEVRRPVRTQKGAEHGDVEGDGFPVRGDGRLQRLRIVVDKIIKRASDRVRAALARQVRGHRPVNGPAGAQPVKARKDQPRIGIAEIGFAARMVVQLREDPVIKAAGAVTAACEPYRVKRGIVGGLEERRAALGVGSGEMA